MSRPTKEEYYLGIAKAVSKRSTCLKRKYGAVIVKNDEIISTGFNGSPRGEINCCDSGHCKRINKPHNTGDYSDCESVHAEQNALISAARKDMIGATLYLYGEEEFETCGPCFSETLRTLCAEVRGHGDCSKEYENCIHKFKQVVTINPEPCPICKRMIKNAGIKRVVTSYGITVISGGDENGSS